MLPIAAVISMVSSIEISSADSLGAFSRNPPTTFVIFMVISSFEQTVLFSLSENLCSCGGTMPPSIIVRSMVSSSSTDPSSERRRPARLLRRLDGAMDLRRPLPGDCFSDKMPPAATVMSIVVPCVPSSSAASVTCAVVA